MEEQYCVKTGCSGRIVDDVCEDCGRSAQPISLVDKFASHLKTAMLNANVLSKLDLNRGDDNDDSSSFNEGDFQSQNLERPLRQERHGTVQHRSLGAGLLHIEPLAKVDPQELLLKDSTVPENKRTCGHCDTQFHHMRGFCPNCGREYNLVPTLGAGDLVADQYEIKGPIAFGGLGWIYLAWDKVLSRLVVLKGLLNSKDEVSAAAALQERRYLAAVKHPNIVGIYNFVSHAREGFIVMEFVSGQTLKQMRQERGPFPVAEAVAFIHRILSAFAHLHKMGLVYCDFKPDNIMFEDDDVKLIDMGAVRRIDEIGGDVFCTRGYSAPEAQKQPTVSSDLYTIARSLAVLVINFKLQNDFQFTLPGKEQEPLFENNDSLYRFLLKATHKEPGRRFESAEEMACQLLGILAETTSSQHSRVNIDSTIFDSHDPLGHLETESYSLKVVPKKSAAVKLLPQMLVNDKDAACEQIIMIGSSTESESVRKNLDEIAVHWPKSEEVHLRLADVRAQLGTFAMADRHLELAEKEKTREWKTQWYRGKILLMKEQPAAARASFEIVLNELPGEAAPKLALALCFELESEAHDEHEKISLKQAKRLYQIVARVDNRHTGAIFGLARCLLREQNKNSSIEALKMVPATSNHYVAAQIAIIRALLSSMPSLPTQKELVLASLILERLEIDGFEKHRLAADLFLSSVEVVEQPKFKADHTKLFGCPFSQDKLRLAAERELRHCARYAQTERERCQIVDEANKIRPLTFF